MALLRVCSPWTQSLRGASVLVAAEQTAGAGTALRQARPGGRAPPVERLLWASADAGLRSDLPGLRWMLIWVSVCLAGGGTGGGEYGSYHCRRCAEVRKP